MANETVDRKTEEWLRGFQLGLVLAEEIGETMWKNGRIDVLDGTGTVVFSSLFRDLAKQKAQR